VFTNTETELDDKKYTSMKKIFTLLFTVLTVTHVLAQSKEKIAYDQVKAQCASMPLEKRARLSVTRFNVTTTSVNDANVAQNANANNNIKAISSLFGRGTDAPRADEIPVTFGSNLATMLTSALQGVSCFRVLETQKNNADLTDEINAGDSKYSSKKAPKAGKQLGPQIVATGEVIEYSVKDKGMTIMGVGTRQKLVKIGFNLKLINPETRDLITSKMIRVESRTGSSVSVMGFVSTDNNDPAVAAVMGDGVVKAVEYLAHVRDSLNITVDNIPGNAPGQATSGSKEIEISLTNANFDSFTTVASVIGLLPGYTSMEKSLSSGVGTYTVLHTGSPDEFLNSLSKKLGGKFEIMGFTDDKIELKVK
jgi:curli biogenesis system outer membrane secretion channel CsgG